MKERKNVSDTKLLIQNIAYSVLIKGAALLVSLLSTPLYIKFFNDDVTLGLWFTLYSVLSWILNFDLGIGNGLRNNLATALSKKDKKKAGSLIYSSYAVSLIFVGIVFVIYVLIKPQINWYSILSIEKTYVNMKALLKAVDIVIVSILLQMLLRNINYIYYAEQKPNINNITALVTSVSIVIYLYMMNITGNTGNIVNIANANLLAVNVPLMYITIIYLYNNKYLVREKFTVSKETVNSVLGLGLKFFYVQIVYMIIASSNEFFINYFCKASDVVEYSIYNKLFTIIGMAVAVLVVPVWSAITKAMAEKRYMWIKKIYFGLIIIGIGSIIFNLLLGIISQQVFDLWLGGETRAINTRFVWVFVFYGAAISMTSILSVFANGMGKIGVQAIIYTIIAIVKIGLSGYITNKIGWIGIILISTVGLWIYNLVQYIITYKNIFRELNDERTGVVHK